MYTAGCNFIRQIDLPYLNKDMSVLKIEVIYFCFRFYYNSIVQGKETTDF